MPRAPRRRYPDEEDDYRPRRRRRSRGAHPGLVALLILLPVVLFLTVGGILFYRWASTQLAQSSSTQSGSTQGAVAAGPTSPADSEQTQRLKRLLPGSWQTRVEENPHLKLTMGFTEGGELIWTLDNEKVRDTQSDPQRWEALGSSGDTLFIRTTRTHRSGDVQTYEYAIELHSDNEFRLIPKSSEAPVRTLTRTEKRLTSPSRLTDPAQVRARDRLLGRWQSALIVPLKGTAPSVEATWEFDAEGHLNISNALNGGAPVTTRGTWELVRVSGDEVVIRRTALGQPQETTLVFLSDQQLQIEMNKGRKVTFNRK